MTFAFKFTGVLVLGLAAIAAALSIGGGKAQAGGATIDCTIPLSVVCEISHPDGIASVVVTVDFGEELGDIDVVDRIFDCQQNVSVSWDPIVPNATISVVPCHGFDIHGGGNGSSGKLGLASRALLRGDSVQLYSPTYFQAAYGGPDTTFGFAGMR